MRKQKSISKLFIIGGLVLEMTVGSLVAFGADQKDKTDPSVPQDPFWTSGLGSNLHGDDKCAWWMTKDPGGCATSTASSTSTGSTTSGKDATSSSASSIDQTNDPTGGLGTGANTGAGASGSNQDPWNWNDDPTWNNNGPVSGGFGNTDDPGNIYSSGWGQYSMPNLPFLERTFFLQTITANYAKRVNSELTHYGLWNAQTIDDVGDKIINDFSLKAAQWGVFAQLGLFLLDYMLDSKWRSMSSWGQAAYGFGMTAGMGGAILTETTKVIEMEIKMTLELMELYNELPVDMDARSDALVGTMLAGLGTSGANRLIAHQLKVDIWSNPIGGPPPPPPGFPTDPTNPLPPVNDPWSNPIGGPGTPGAPGSPTGAVGAVEKTAGEIAAETGRNANKGVDGAIKIFSEGMERKGFGAKILAKFGVNWMVKVRDFLRARPAYERMALASMLIFAIDYTSAKAYGKFVKKVYRARSQIRQHRIIRAFKNSFEARDAVWLLLTKFVFKPQDGRRQLTDADAKQYAAIISQEIPLLHHGNYVESDDLFAQYKSFKGADVTVDKSATSSGGMVHATNLIDDLVTRLRSSLPDPNQRLYLIRLVEGGMLMKGYLTPSDSKTLNTVAIELGLTYPVSKQPNDSNPIMGIHYRYLTLKDGMASEVTSRSLAEDRRAALGKNYADWFNGQTGANNKHWRSGKIILEDFYNQNEVAIAKVEQEAKGADGSGLHDDQKEEDLFKKAAVLAGDKKAPPLPPLSVKSADGTDPKTEVPKSKAPGTPTTNGKKKKPASPSTPPAI